MSSLPEHPPETLTTCYRHPDRRAGVTCQRCDRPICPSCMVTASVGFQCPECAKAGAKQSRTIDVGRMVNRATMPVVTYTLIAMNVAVYLIGSIINRGVNLDGLTGSFDERFWLFTPDVGRGEWYRLISGGFMHAGLLHLGLNMWALYVVGSALEPILGRARMLLLYAVALLGGALGVVLLYSPGQGPTVGASGAIFGLFGALAVLLWTRGINPFKNQIGWVIGLNLVFTFGIPGISIGGHIAGLVIGAAAAGVLLWGRELRDQPSSERSGRAAAAAAIGLACFGAALVIARSKYGLG